MTRKGLIPLILLGGIAAASLGVTLGSWSIASLNWGLVSTLVLLVFLGLLMWSAGHQPVNTIAISVTATLAALASLGRILFAAVASVQPATFLVLLSGYVFGSRTGFIVGTMAGLISNFFLGHGPWTLWQMIAWGICGIIGGVLGQNKSQLVLMPFLVVSAGAGYFFGLFMNTWHWLNFVYPLNWQTLVSIWASSFIFDTMHAVGNVIFAIVFGRTFFDHLVRYRNRFLPVNVTGRTHCDE
ncbi:MAG TPA: ECF transporter S component [Syntrophomonadaceae bacterium]|nr:ECF transporter S component [Syntrophomonadaceae bacterium]HQE23908.1 ECF transporter S component [Syntrophomonadaceae bacterium]